MKSAKPLTPNKASKMASENSSTKKKQLSLMSFFKPAAEKKPLQSLNSSSPLKPKSKTTIADSTSDKENEDFDTSMATDTPLTSDSLTPRKPDIKVMKSSPIKSPIKDSNDMDIDMDSEDEKILSSKKRRRVLDSDDEFEDTIFIKNESDTENTSFDSKPDSTSSLESKFTSSSDYKTTKPKLKVPKTNILQPPAKKNFVKENEERYQWLVELKDAEKRGIDHPEYDSRTLYIPQSAWAKFTPFEKQYWEIKSTMYDTVVFFKKGKFYELYENDALIANSEFDLKIAGGGRANMKLAGIPEMSFEYWAKEFINHGYRVAKVDQKESMLAKQMRGGGTKEEKVIHRELSGILTGGTLTDLNMISDDMSIYCLSIKQLTQNDGTKTFGVAFVDTATSELNILEFVDDNECNKLDTLITQIKPKEIICEKNNLCSIAVKIIKFNSYNDTQIWNQMNPITEFWDYDITLENLAKAKYYEAEDLDDYSRYPKILVDIKDNYKVAFNAFGGLLSYLTTLKLDTSIMTMANIHEYDITRSSSSTLVLDGITLTNLEILNNTFDGSDRGTLFKLLNKAITPFGKRLLKTWTLYPLMNVKEINQRYDAVDWLTNDGLDFRARLEQGLTGLPDLERLLSRVHSNGLRFKDFVKVIESFEKLSKLFIQLKKDVSTESGALYNMVDSFPQDALKCLEEWEDAFDRVEALNDIVVPKAGIDEEFDDSHAKMSELESQLDDHLKEYKKQYKSLEICYKDSGKEIYLIEMPNKLSKSIPNDWQQMGATNKVKRYWSPEVRVLVQELLEQRELHKLVCENLKSSIYKKFDLNYNTWKQVIETAGSVDCLLALTRASDNIGYPSCRPEFIESNTGELNFTELRHPCFTGTKDFIPNDVILGGNEPKFGLLTGANAAGKSTLMRTTSLAVILSQIGCYIPASLAKLTPVDKIMTRLGANDNIMQGKSTFFVELSETKKILSQATNKSLVILDELGRGGSSSDGYAIAESVLYHLSTHVQCLGFFATHYGNLGSAFINHPQIKPVRMAIIVDGESRKITFLHKLEVGAASGSFGMNVASMCGISDKIVDEAEVAAEKYEQTHQIKGKTEEIKLSLGLQSDFAWSYNNELKLQNQILQYDESVKKQALVNVFRMIDEF